MTYKVFFNIWISFGFIIIIIIKIFIFRREWEINVDVIKYPDCSTTFVVENFILFYQKKNIFFLVVYSQEKGKENSSLSYTWKTMGCISYGFSVKGFGRSCLKSSNDRQSRIGISRCYRFEKTLQRRSTRSSYLRSSSPWTSLRSSRQNVQYRPIRISFARLQSLCE